MSDRNQFVISGRLRSRETRTYANGEKQFLAFFVDVGGKYPITIEFSAFGETAGEVESARMGEQCLVVGKLNTREYNGRSYVQLNVSSFVVLGPGEPSPSQQYGQEPPDMNIPF